MRVYRLMKKNANGPSTEVFKTYDCSEFDLYITKQIYAGNISYDPACYYPSKEKQVDMFCKDLWKGYEHFDGIDHEHWIDIRDLDPTKNRDDYIMSVLHEHHKEAKELGYEVMVTILQGSQNYGLDIYNDSYKSDIDSKAIVIPTFEDFVVGRSPVSHTHERENKEHIDLKDIRIMFDTFKKQNVNFVEILFINSCVFGEKNVSPAVEGITISAFSNISSKKASILSSERKSGICVRFESTSRQKIQR